MFWPWSRAVKYSNNKIMSESKLHHLPAAVPREINRWDNLWFGCDTQSMVMCEKIVLMRFKREMKVILHRQWYWNRLNVIRIGHKSKMLHVVACYELFNCHELRAQTLKLTPNFTRKSWYNFTNHWCLLYSDSFYCHCSSWFLITFGNFPTKWVTHADQSATAICQQQLPDAEWWLLHQAHGVFEKQPWWHLNLRLRLRAAGGSRHSSTLAELGTCVRTHQCAAAYPRRNVSSVYALNGCPG